MKDRKKPYFGSRQNVSEKIVSFDRIYFFKQRGSAQNLYTRPCVRGSGGEAPGKIFTVENPYLAKKGGGQGHVKCSRNLTVVVIGIRGAQARVYPCA